jgi:aminoglycoside phosphotransferase (APT) family kinase protein
MDGLVIDAPAFAPDHLSHERPEAVALDAAAAAPVRAAVRAGWGIEARAIGLLRTGGTTAANHLIDGVHVLKRRSEAAALAREVARLRRAQKAGVAVPGLRAPRFGPAESHIDANGAWALYDFVPGTHFRGQPGELGLAAAAFNALARAFAGEASVLAPAWNDVPARIATALATAPRCADPAAEAVLAAHADTLAAALAADGGRDLGPLEILHTDLHPMNLLFDGGRAVVLDFEDVSAAPRAVAAGFALLKLGREFLSRMPAVSRRARAWEAVAEWTAHAPADPGKLHAGARRRVLANIAEILEAWRLRGNAGANHGLIRQLGSLAEADYLFGSPAIGVSA